MDQLKTTLTDFLVRYGFQVVGAIIILIAGAFLARWVGNLLNKSLQKYKLEPPICSLLVRVLRLLVFGLAVILALNKFGVEIMPLVMGLGVVGVGVGFAAQGVLGNILAGLTIIFTKPFRVGEYVELVGVYGQVTNIELFSTTLLHGDQSRVVVPNRKIVGEILHNYGSMRQLNLSVGVAYGSDLNRALATVREILESNSRVLKTPAPVVGIEALGESSITLGIKPWVPVPDYTAAQLEIYRAIVEQFRAQGIEIPFPQHEVRMLGQ